jgi:hypothetical protein
VTLGVYPIRGLTAVTHGCLVSSSFHHTAVHPSLAPSPITTPLHSIPCAMPQNSRKKKPGHRSSRSKHLPTHSVPNSSHFEGGSALQSHESQPPIGRSEMPASNQGTPRPFPAPTPQPYGDQIASGTLGGTMSLFHGASNFQTRDFHVHVGDKSIDGTSTD